MSKERIRTTPDLAATSIAHQKAIEAGTDHFFSYQYNVADHFKDKTKEQIKQTLKDTAYPFSVCAEHIIGDYNLGSIIRTANAHNAKEFFYVGDKKYDKRSTVGSHNYLDVQWLSTIDEMKNLSNKYIMIGIDNIPGSISLYDYKFKPDTCFVFGEEGVGLTPTSQELCKDIIHIPQFGSIRSLNVGTAAGIIMYKFVEQMNVIQ
jgi:tRNA G18 (ribose-2'-O)-methylase SpoU